MLDSLSVTAKEVRQATSVIQFYHAYESSTGVVLVQANQTNKDYNKHLIGSC